MIHMSLAWQHLISKCGKSIAQSDLLMLEHEFFESILMEKDNMTYQKAHAETDKIHNYREALKKEGIDHD